MHDIELQYVADCPNLPVLLERLEAVTCGRVDIRLREVDPDTLLPAGFSGSPTLLINGQNPYGSVDPNAGVNVHPPHSLCVRAQGSSRLCEPAQQERFALSSSPSD